jgi:hypothetical protein
VIAARVRDWAVRRINADFVREHRPAGYPPQGFRLSYLDLDTRNEVWVRPGLHLLFRWLDRRGGRWALHRVSYALGFLDVDEEAGRYSNGRWRLAFWRVHRERVARAYQAGMEDAATIIREEMERARRIARITEGVKPSADQQRTASGIILKP